MPAASMVLGAILSIQLGSAVAVGLFDEVGAAGVVFLRSAFAAVVLLVMWRPSFRVNCRARRLTLLYGLTLAGVSFCFYESIDRIPLGTAVTLEFAGPLAVALITSHHRRDWLWAGLAATGIVLLTGGIGGGSLDPVGIFFALAAGVFWGAYILLGARVGAESTGGGPLAIAMLASAVMLAPSGLVSGGVDLLDAKVLIVGLAIGVLGATIPFSLELEAMRRLPSNVFGVMMSLEPAVAAAIGFVVLDQRIGSAQAFAILLVVMASAGALYFSRRPTRVEPERSPPRQAVSRSKAVSDEAQPIRDR